MYNDDNRGVKRVESWWKGCAWISDLKRFSESSITSCRRNEKTSNNKFSIKHILK